MVARRPRRAGAPPSSTLSEELDAFFGARAEARVIFEAVRAAIDELGAAAPRVTKSQIAFARRRGFAWAWTPDRYLKGETAPLVVSFALSRRRRGKRIKEVVEPSPGRFMHHVELRAPEDVDEQLRSWFADAAGEAGELD